MRTLFVLLTLLVSQFAFAESISIPLKVVKKPASDLVSNGAVLEVGQAATMAKQGQDLSILNPQENKMWQNQKYGMTDATQPREVAVRYQSSEAQLPFTFMARVQSGTNPEVFYRLSLSRMTHTTLMRAALMKKLGYYVPTPQYSKNLRVYFKSEEEKADFLRMAQETMISDFESRGWVTENDTKNHSLVFSDAMLEPATNDYFDIQWGYAPDPNDPSQVSVVQRFSRYRAYRALIIPFSLVDLPESVNRFSAKFASVLSGHIVITHPAAESFSACSYEDAKWLVRRLNQFTEQDFRDIVKAGAFPQELEELIYAKLLYRANNAMELFGLSTPWKLPSLKINSASGLVKDGKVTREMVPGYPQRFAHGDRESPFKDGDFERYLGIRGRTAAIMTAMNHINEKLDILSVGDLVLKRRLDVQNKIIEHISKNPEKPLYQNVEAWGGPVGGFNMAATRSVSTGTYYGSQAAIQLVDNMSVAARLGFFMALDGVPNVTPMGGANIMVQRDYTHVRPLLSITEGTKVEWKNLIIPKYMRSLTNVLSKEKNEDGKFAIDAMLGELREGEVFTVTDSVTLAGYAQISASIDVLLGITPLSFMNTVSVGADGARVILRQTSFMRTADGVQVYVREQSSKIFGLSFDVNYFINVMNIRASTNTTDLHTDTFVIDYNPALGEYVDEGQTDQQFVKDFIETRDNLRPALIALFRGNDPEILYSRFQYKKFEIDHELKTKEVRSKFLAMRMDSFNEDHLLKITYPASPDAPELNPKDEQVILFSNKRGTLVGRDLLGFATDWIQGIINKKWGNAKVDLGNGEDPNPANTPFGKAYWRIVNTETDLTPKGETYPNVAILQHVWGGWHLNSKKFMKLIDEIQGQFKNTPLAPYRLIEPEAFANTTAINFYRVTAQLSVLPGGLDKIRDLLVQPDSVGKPAPKPNIIERILHKLSIKDGRPPRAGDKEFFEDLLKIIGNGDLEKGRMLYEVECKNNKAPPAGASGSVRGDDTTTWLHGTRYECLENWTKKLINLSAEYPTLKSQQARWTSEVLYILDEQIPLPQLLKYLGEENYVFVVRINGFREGDEDGDLEYFSNTLGDPKTNIEYANGLISMFATKTRISPIELDRSQAGFR
ncbi:hypothetical protein [Bdellovibrio sp. HCB337]|uniref:hypothetical protein n=1 Tax=Bdellovibrio sp. HCB337 TaxID=3394358 RepID=UPI0039A5DB95